jgi:hypothetical protein
MLFNLTTNKEFKCILHKFAIECGEKIGPKFGKGDLKAVEPFNGDNNC